MTEFNTVGVPIKRQKRSPQIGQILNNGGESIKKEMKNCVQARNNVVPGKYET
jgi:hypothetical protein